MLAALLGAKRSGQQDAAASYSGRATDAHHCRMDTELETSWAMASGLSELHGLSYGGEPQDSGCAGELDLTLGRLTAANDLAFGHPLGQTPTAYVQP